jgi:hypothetical protein
LERGDREEVLKGKGTEEVKRNRDRKVDFEGGVNR